MTTKTLSPRELLSMNPDEIQLENIRPYIANSEEMRLPIKNDLRNLVSREYEDMHNARIRGVAAIAESMKAAFHGTYKAMAANKAPQLDHAWESQRTDLDEVRVLAAFYQRFRSIPDVLARHRGSVADALQELRGPVSRTPSRPWRSYEDPRPVFDVAAWCQEHADIVLDATKVRVSDPARFKLSVRDVPDDVAAVLTEFEGMVARWIVTTFATVSNDGMRIGQIMSRGA